MGDEYLNGSYSSHEGSPERGPFEGPTFIYLKAPLILQGRKKDLFIHAAKNS